MIVVNSSTRQFNIPGADLVFGVTDDSGSETKHFQCPRYVGNGVDIASSFVRINYRNANGVTDFHKIDNITVDGDNVLFDWELHPKVTKYKGNVTFVMCVVGPDLKVKWHTTLGRGQVLEGLEPDNESILEETEDAVAQLIAMVENQTATVEAEGEKWVADVKSEGVTQVKAVQTAAKTAETASVAEIEAKGVNTRNSIPADYTALSEAVETLNRTRGAVIVCETAGETVMVNDASDLPMQGLRIFGRSTQDGTPTPEAPVEIKSVEKPVVKVCGKNLIDITPAANSIFVETNGVWTFMRGENTNRFSEYVPIYAPPNVPITMSLELLETTTVAKKLDFYYVGMSKNNYYGSCSNTFTKTYDEPIVGIVFYLQSSEAVGVYHRFKNLQIEIGPKATNYESHRGIQTISTTHTLPGIPVTSGGNYTDSDGQQWICDEVDLERGVYVRKVKQLTLDGSEAWKTSSGKYIYMRTDEYAPKSSRGFCSCVPYKYSYEGDGIFAIENTIYLGAELSQRFNMDVTTWTNILTESPATLLYNLATPIETALSETEIAAYRALHSNYPNTTVLNDSGAHMVVKYAADTKLYIDNKITALIGG